MRRFQVWIAAGVLTAVLVMPRSVEAQGFSVNEHGSCSMGRGGTGVASPCADGSASFINPAGLESRGQNLYFETAASGTAQTGAPGSSGLGTLAQGFVETSNFNVVEELVSMIATQRAYELNSKAIQTSDQMLQRLGNL